MSFYIPPPQQFLDELHDAGVPELFEPQMTPRNRADAIRASRRKLSRVKQSLNQTKDQIIQRHSTKKKDDGSSTVKLKLAPYAMLSNLELELEKQVDNLEKLLGAGKLLPDGFQFGEVIFGSDETGEWFLGTEDDLFRWQETMDIKAQLTEFMRQRAPLVSKQQAFKERKERLEKRIKKDSRKLRARGSFMFIGLIMLVLLGIGGGLAGYGGYQIYLMGNFNNLASLMDSAGTEFIMLAVGALFIFSAPIVYAGWRRQITHLSDTITNFKHEVASIEEDMRLLYRDYSPVNEKCKVLHQEYKELRATFQ